MRLLLFWFCAIFTVQVFAADLGNYDHLIDGLSDYQFDMRPAAPGRSPELIGKQRMMGMIKGEKSPSTLEVIGVNLNHAIEKVVLDISVSSVERQQRQNAKLLKTFVDLLLPEVPNRKDLVVQAMEDAVPDNTVTLDLGDKRLTVQRSVITNSFVFTIEAS
ncbi:ribosomal RNA large subunit methyltransferase K/L [Pseudomonas chlororaphis subsp. aurantiaca]|uniref:hypothetical protein n=1 Tax=Pseudomonas chlororaphis TaxID=587753 RepID=UPI000864D224|nr:hypothetical protein [Pseudomonas chlororaphis]BAV74133.1 ribosomal RNA large subunit methyltransferase K/L [Pseudomonas chlororaphis subsp. aurantiaca]